MKNRILFIGLLLVFFDVQSQTVVPAEDLLKSVRAKLDQVNDYQAKGTMKTNVIFLRAPIAHVKIYYKKPNKLRIHNESGISLVPKGSVNINLSNIFLAGNFDIIDMGKENGLRVIKLLPRNEEAEVVLSTLYIDEATQLVKKAKTTTRENGSYQLEMSYSKYAAFGLADRIVFSFNTKEYKLPKGVTFDYDNGGDKKDKSDQLKNRKGTVEIVYSSYIINKGIPDSIFD
jgi:outer membrane lipoprotein-sorting protein